MIQIRDIKKSFGSLEVLKGIDLTIEKGEVVSIVGPSGAGKTTLLQIIGSLDRADSGSVTFGGQDITRLSQRKLADFRNRRLKPHRYNRLKGSTEDQRHLPLSF